MDLLNQTLNNFSSQISDLSISFNPDIFEANLVNLTLLVGGILGAIQESEERLQEAVTRLAESEKQLEQAQTVIESIKTDSQTTAKQVKSAILTDGRAEIERLTSSAKSQITSIEAKVRKQISDYVIYPICKVNLNKF